MPAAGLPWVVILAPAGVLLLIAAVVVLIVVGVQVRPGPVRWAAAAVVAVFVVGVVTGLTLRVIVLPSESMADTLRVGDRLLVTTVRPGLLPLRRGDVIVFRDPGGWLSPEGAGADPGYLVKRVIGLPGDRIVCCDAADRLTVNGVALDERYVPAGDLPSAEPFSVVVAPGGLWVLGDHRSASWDSRYHVDVRDGQVPVAGVVGTVVMVVWPSSRLGIGRARATRSRASPELRADGGPYARDDGRSRGQRVRRPVAASSSGQGPAWPGRVGLEQRSGREDVTWPPARPAAGRCPG